jgi:hypothetical protein
MKVINPDLYRAARRGSVTFPQVNDFLRFSDWRDQHDPSKRDQVGERVENWWRYALGDLGNDDLITQFERSLSPYGIRHPSRIITYFCEIIDGFSFPDAIGG